MSSSRIQLIPLFKGLALATEDTQGTQTPLELDVPAVRNLLPHCEALFLFALTEGVAANMIDWNVAFYSGFDRNHQPSSPINIASSPLGAPGSSRTLDYDDVGNFMLDTRLVLWWANKTGVSGVKTPILSAVLGARMIGQ